MTLFLCVMAYCAVPTYGAFGLNAALYGSLPASRLRYCERFQTPIEMMTTQQTVLPRNMAAIT